MPNQPTTEQTFESSLLELENIVAAMDAGQLPLQESLNAYQRGVELLRQCQATLNRAEQQIQILDANGLQPFDTNSDKQLDEQVIS